jgi:hypothetical protein
VLPLHHSPPKQLISLDFLRKSSKIAKESRKTSHSRRRYSGLRVHGLVLFADDLEPLAAVRSNLHLVAEAHVVGDVLARHSDIVGDLVDVVPLLGPGKDSRTAQAVDCRMVGIVRVDIPFVFLDLRANPFFPAAADDAAFRRVGQPSAPTCTEAVPPCESIRQNAGCVFGKGRVADQGRSAL